jgi:hypothetical protein
MEVAVEVAEEAVVSAYPLALNHQTLCPRPKPWTGGVFLFAVVREEVLMGGLGLDVTTPCPSNPACA